MLLRYILLVLLFVPFSLFLAITSGIVQFFAYAGLVTQISSMKCGTFLYSVMSRFLLFSLGIAVPTVNIKQGSFIVANHVSWLDGFIFAAAHKCTIITKGELNSLFYIGFLLKRFSSIPVFSDDIHSVLNAMNTCNEYLDAGISVLVFPEGTTRNQDSVDEFHALFFEIPIKRKQTTTVVSISYDSNFPCWVGDESLINNINRVVNTAYLNSITVNLKCSEISSLNVSRKILAENSRNIIASFLGIIEDANCIRKQDEFLTHSAYLESPSLKIIESILNDYLSDDDATFFGGINVESNFSELNIDSLGIVTLGVELERRVGRSIDLKVAYIYNTPLKLAIYLDGHHGSNVNTHNHSGEVIVANTSNELKKIARLRFDIYVTEQGKQLFFADATQRLLLEPVDAFNESVVIYTASETGITSSMRVEYRTPDWLLRQLPFSPKGISNLKAIMLARAVVSPTVRGSQPIMALSQWVMEKFHSTHEMALVTCTSELSEFFIHYGFKISEYVVQHPDVGSQKLLALFTCTDDREYELSDWLKIQ